MGLGPPVRQVPIVPHLQHQPEGLVVACGLEVPSGHQEQPHLPEHQVDLRKGEIDRPGGHLDLVQHRRHQGHQPRPRSVQQAESLLGQPGFQPQEVEQEVLPLEERQVPLSVKEPQEELAHEEEGLVEAIALEKSLALEEKVHHLEKGLQAPENEHEVQEVIGQNFSKRLIF